VALPVPKQGSENCGVISEWVVAYSEKGSSSITPLMSGSRKLGNESARFSRAIPLEPRVKGLGGNAKWLKQE
jgi:hypothetical protein